MSKSKTTDPPAAFVGDARLKEAFRRLVANESFESLDVSGHLQTIAPHPIATEIPPMDFEEFTRLVMRVREFGFREPVVLTADLGQVVEGRHRVATAWVLGIPLRKLNTFGPAERSDSTKVDKRYTLQYLVLTWAEAELRELSTDKNDIRRHYTPALAALLAWNRYGPKATTGAKARMAGVAPIGASGDEEGVAPIGASGGKAAAEVAKLSGLSQRTIERISIVSATETPKTYERVWYRDITSVLAAHNAAKDELAEIKAASMPPKPSEPAAPPKEHTLGKSLDKAIELLGKDMEKLRAGFRSLLSADEQRERLLEIRNQITEWFETLDRDDRENTDWVIAETPEDGPPF